MNYSGWECYAPDKVEPVRFEDGSLVRDRFVGWSGLGPIAMHVQFVLGIDTDAATRSITWRLQRIDRHGVERLSLGDGVVDLICEARPAVSSAARIHVKTTQPFDLVLQRGEQSKKFSLPVGEAKVSFEKGNFWRDIHVIFAGAELSEPV